MSCHCVLDRLDCDAVIIADAECEQHGDLARDDDAEVER